MSAHRYNTIAVISLCAVTACTLMSLCSCIYQYPDDDCIPPGAEGKRVTYDWGEAPGAGPAGMAACFYPAGGGDYWSFNLPATGGGIDIPDGSYDIASYNNDSEAVIVADVSSFSTLTFSTRPGKITDGLRVGFYGAPPPESREEMDGQPVMRQPDMMWTAIAGDEAITDGTTVTMRPAKVVASYSIEISGITNLHSVSQSSISLSGLAGIYRPFSGLEADSVPVILPGSVARASDSSLAGTMMTFGVSPKATANILRLYLWLSDGEKLVYEWDVAGQIASAPDRMNLRIKVSGIELPDLNPAPGPDAGLAVDVDNWEVVNIELST